MKKLLFYLALAPLALPMSPLRAQPAATAPTTPTGAATPDIDPQAMALLDQSAAAYKALAGLSMRYASNDTQGDKTEASSGSVAFQRPGRARIVTSSDAKVPAFITNSASAKTADDAANLLRGAMARIPNASTVFLVRLVNGENPLTTAPGTRTARTWTDVKTLPDNGVSMTTVFGQGARQQPMTFSLYFDPTDHLLRRVEAKASIKGESYFNVTTFSEVQLNPTFAPETFAYKAPTAEQLAAERSYFDPKLKPGVTPYALTGADLTGKTISLPAYKGKVVLLDFWATWCGPCVGELPNVLANYKKYHAKGFDIIGVSLDESKSDLTGFIKARQMPWPQLFDGKGWKNVNSTRYGVRAIPFTLLVGKDGKIAAVNPRGPELEPAVKKALALP